MDGAEGDGAEWEGEIADPNYVDLNCTSLHLTVVASMAQMKVKWSDAGKGTERWRMILMIRRKDETITGRRIPIDI